MSEDMETTKAKRIWAQRAIARGCLCTDIQPLYCEMHYGMLPEVSDLRCQCDCHYFGIPNTVRGKVIDFDSRN